LFSLRHSNSLTVTHLIGPAVELRSPPKKIQKQQLQRAKIYEIDTKDSMKFGFLF
jgi:hypothetical protein